MMPSSGISNLGICRQVSRDALDFDLPSCIGEVCPPGGHMLERGVQAQLGAKRRRGGWLSVCTSCVDSRTDRCTLCPYWRCSNDECQWEAWDNSAGLQQAWNHEAGMTVSRTLYRAHGKLPGCIYNNSEKPWGVTEGRDPPEGSDGGKGKILAEVRGAGVRRVSVPVQRRGRDAAVVERLGRPAGREQPGWAAWQDGVLWAGWAES